MGKKAEFTRSRFREVRQKHQERQLRSRTERDRRHGIDKTKRMIDKVVTQRALPGKTEQDLLLSQFSQACRLAGPSIDLCLLMRHYADMREEARTTTADAKEPAAKSAARKRPREDETALTTSTDNGAVFLDAVAEALLQTRCAPAVLEGAAIAAAEGADVEEAATSGVSDEEDDPMTVLQDILQDDSGRRVVATLLASLNAVRSSECEPVASAVLAEFEENEYLPQHHVACRVMSALVQYGSEVTRQGVLNLLRQRGTSTEAVEQLLSDRHTAGTIEQLLKHHRIPTAAWLCEVLSLAPAKGMMANKGKKETSKKRKTVNVDEKVTDEVSPDLLMRLINGPVSGQVFLQLASTDARRELLRRLSITDLLQSKRGTIFLTQLLTLSPLSTSNAENEQNGGGDAEVAAEAAAVFCDVLERLGNDLGEMATDKRANFVVQGLILLLPTMGAQGVEQFEGLERGLGGAAGISALAAHGNGVHVVLSLIDAAFKLPKESVVEKLAEQLVTRHNVGDLFLHQYGSLVVRRLMPLISRKSSKVGRLLHGMVEQDMSNLVYTEAGNLAVQAYLTALGKTGTSQLGQKLASSAEDLLAMCRSPYASHVVFALFELVDPATHTLLCNALTPHVLRLSTHVNGRFIVEKMITASRDVREHVSKHFLPLAQERGTQHLLCALFASMDARGKQACLEKAILPHLVPLATHQCGSIVLQKLMQSEPTVLAAVQRRLSANSLMRSDMAQNFFGKFVVQIAQPTSG